MRSGSVLVSMVVHAAALVVALIVPFVAPNVLPAVHMPLPAFMRAYRAADIPLPVAPSPRRSGATARTRIPVAAPDGILPETPRPPIARGEVVPFGLEEPTGGGLPAGFGLGETIAPLPPPPLPRPPRASEPRRVGGVIRTPARRAYVAPVYPPIALSAHVHGDVVVEAIIGVDGAVQNVRAVRSDSPLLTDSALAAVSRWRYTPTLLNGIPVPVVMTVTVAFRIR